MPEKIKKNSLTNLSRRDFLMLTAGLAGGTFLSSQIANLHKTFSTVAVVKVPKYSLGIKSLLKPYFNQFNLKLYGKTVLLKPNIVDFHNPEHYIYTNPDILIAAIELFGDIGAKVIVAEGSGLRRDINTILHESHYKEILNKYSVEFIDLNLDSVDRVKIPSNFTGLDYFYIPKTILDADFIVSLPKMKTHHWMGVTLSIKNMFGIMPGTKYGWPKNRLHTVGVGNSILDINYTVKSDFTIIDGVYGIEGNGPLFGENKYAGVVIMSNDLLAADTVAAKIMGIDPEKVEYLKAASLKVNNKIDTLGNMYNINVIGTSINEVKTNFKLLDEFKYLRA